MQHLVNWIELPVSDMDRACRFYSEVLGIDLHRMTLGGAEYAMFPTDDRFNAGALVKSVGHRPATDGPLVYLDGGPDLAPVLTRISAAGGKVVMPRTFLSPEAGWVGVFLDSEGNRVGLQHS